MQRPRNASWLKRRAWLAWLVVGGGLVAAGYELPYVDWQAVVPPVDAQPLIVRVDAKGDGRFWSLRSGNRRHRGVDLAAPLHSPVRAIRSGTVTETGSHRGLGRFIELSHRGGLRSLYAHLARVDVEPGARVRQGDVIGLVGKTGNARHRWITPHVHLEVWRNGEPIDPATLGLAVTEPEREELDAHRGG
ncbi:MAG: M23 family metallopeptidase [Candidatus Omnitrophica bacterium]|nr:M23 family metallopeptidase [Candidatus Omnitrophota bacterium]